MDTAPSPALPPQPPPASCWSTIVKKKPAPSPPLSSCVFPRSNSTKGISVAVVDANAIIHGDKLAGYADKFVSVREVLEEVRDPVSRQRLAFLPFTVETVEPSPDSIKKVVKFARETGDLQTLSEVDLKLIALTYMLESQIHGTSHLRNRPPPLCVVNVKNFPEAQMPGWGDNVPNLAKWEALEQGTEAELNHDSHILQLKDLNDNAISKSEVATQLVEQQDEHQSAFRHRRRNFPKREIKIEGKKMVADGVDASKGENTDNVDDWRPAVSRSTHRRYLKRKAWRESRMAAEVHEHSVEEASMTDYNNKDDEAISLDDDDCADFAKHEDYIDAQFEHESPKNDRLEASDFIENDISLVFEQISLVSDKPEEEEDHAISNIQIKSGHNLSEKNALNYVCTAVEDDYEICERQSDKLEVSSNAEGSIHKSFFDDASSEQSWMLQSLSDSTVACVTSDYAMQNVILQIGLRLLALGGMQIRKLHRWVLKCHACNNVTQEIGKIFCPKCGNGGTLRKVSVTVDDNGIVLASRRQRIILRGTKFSLPLPHGGRDAITKNLILREDQLPHKLLYPKVKKKSNNQDEDFMCLDDIFSNASEKRAPLKPPVRKALAMFSGKRNPNDNHFSRKH